MLCEGSYNYKMLSAVMETNDGFHGACYGLAAIYFLMLVWCLWKLAIFSSISRTWTGQKTIHACTAGAAGGTRAVYARSFRHIAGLLCKT